MKKKNNVIFVAVIFAAIVVIGTGCQMASYKIPEVTIARPSTLPQRPMGKISFLKRLPTVQDVFKMESNMDVSGKFVLPKNKN